jgi:dipeptidyl-peptidase-4
MLASVFASLIVTGLAVEEGAQNPLVSATRAPSRAVDSAAVAALPAPGTTVPTAIAFSPDDKTVTYLNPESPGSLTRVLWSAPVAGAGEPRVIARPPNGGDTDTNVSREEALRRERQRLRDSGITQLDRASGADRAVIPITGDLYLLEGDTPLRRLTESTSPDLDPKLNRSGIAVAFVRDGELFVIDLNSGKEARLTHGATEGLTHGLAEFMAQEEMGRQTGYWWSPDGATIAFQETDERHIPLYTITHQGKGEPAVETHRYPFPGKANAKVRLGIVSITGGEPRWLDYTEPSADAYLARVTWDGPGSLLVQVLSRDQKSLRIIRLDAHSGSRTTLHEERSRTWVNLHDDLRVIPETHEFLWSSERTGFRHLELRDREGKLVRTLSSGDWAVDSVLALDPKRREVWFSAGRESPLEMQVYRVSLDGGPITRVTRERGMHRAVVASDGEHFVDTYSSRTRPWVTTIRNREGRIDSTLDDQAKDPRVAEYALTPPVITQFKNRDGNTLYGAYYAPKSRRLGEKAPLIVMVYGGPHLQVVTNSWGLGSNAAAMTADLTAHFLTGLGFAVWKCDNRGSARRGQTFEEPVYRQMGNVEVRDQVDGVHFVAASWPEVDTNRVGVTGGSYGGYMTLRCLTQAPETFRAGVAVAPVTDWDGYDTCYTERYMGTPENNADGYRGSSVLSSASALVGKLLIIHGLLDENVHFRHTARLTGELIAAGKAFDLLTLPEARHSSRKAEDRKYVAERMAKFFEEALRAP